MGVHRGLFSPSGQYPGALSVYVKAGFEGRGSCRHSSLAMVILNGDLGE